MGVLDIFAWIVLVVLVVCTVAVIIFMAMLPGMIARSRNHPWAQAVTVVCAYVDIPARKREAVQ